MKNIEIYKSNSQKFYYLEVTDKSLDREKTISSLLGETHDSLFINYKDMPHLLTDLLVGNQEGNLLVVDNILHAKFSKQKLLTHEHTKVVEISQEEFIKLIPDEHEISDSLKNEFYFTNLKMKKHELDLISSWDNLKKKYKCIGAYKQVEDPENWKPCKNCDLIPLVWEFNNGRSTSCGCGENIYRHHSIQAESIMSWVTRNSGSALGYDRYELRNNWNHWVDTGQDLFELKKELTKDIW